MAKGLTRRITRKQARSYEKLSPNGMGVTSIASVNGRGAHGRNAYAKAYQSTRKMLGGSTMAGYTSNKKRRAKRNPGSSSAGYTKAYASSPYWTARSAARPAAAASRRAGPATSPFGTGRSIGGLAAAPAGAAAARRGGAAAPWFKFGTMPKKGWSVKVSKKALKAAGYTPAQIGKMMKAKHSTKRSIAGRKASAKRKQALIGKKYGKYKTLVAKLDGVSMPTYVRKGKKGRLKKVPIWTLAGTKSPREYTAKTRVGSPGFDDKVYKRQQRILAGRRSAAKKMFKYGGIFTPNEKPSAMSYKEWSEMTPNKRKARRRGKRRYHANFSAKQRAAAMKNLRKARSKLKHGGAKRKARKGGKRKYARNATGAYAANRRKSRHARVHKKLHGAARKGHLRHAAAELKAYASHGPKKRRGVTKRKAKAASRTLSKYVPNEAFLGNQMYDENRRHGRRKHKRGKKSHHAKMVGYRRNEFIANRRHKGHRRSYRRNPDFMATLQDTAKQAFAVAGGIALHRIVTHVVNEQLAKVSALNTGAIAPWKDVIGSALVGVAGVFGLSQAGDFAYKREVMGGVFASFLYGLVVAVAKQAVPTYAGYLGEHDVGGQPGKAYLDFGEYVAASGYGAYELQPASGYGEYVAASGFGAPPMLMQAAANGYGQIMEASAGYGQPIMEASAGVGEFVMSGIEGIGDYELSGDLTQAQAGYGYYDGIRPDTRSAEMALTTAEAQAGIGDLPPQSTVMPQMAAQPIEDVSRGSRAGILEGGDGIFG